MTIFFSSAYVLHDSLCNNYWIIYYYVVSCKIHILCLICLFLDIFADENEVLMQLSSPINQIDISAKSKILATEKHLTTLDKTNGSMWPAAHWHVYLPCKDEHERGCSFITARSKVKGSFRVFIEDEDFCHEKKNVKWRWSNEL